MQPNLASVRKKCSANSCALSNKIDLIACQGVFNLIQIELENAVYCNNRQTGQNAETFFQEGSNAKEES